MNTNENKNINNNNKNTNQKMNKKSVIEVDGIKVPNTIACGFKLFFFKTIDSMWEPIKNLTFMKLPQNNLRPRKKDYTLLWVLVALTIIGLASLYSAYTFEIFNNKNVVFGILPSSFLKQIGFYLFAWILYILIIKYFNIYYLKKASLFYLIIFFVLIVLTAFVGVDNGTSARRWLNLKAFVIQPAELGKLIFPVIFAQIMAANKEFEFKDLINKYTIWITSICLIAIFLVFKKMPDTGTTLAYGVVFLCMLAMANISEKMQKLIAWIITTTAAVGVFAMVFLPQLLTRAITTESFQSGRITSFLDPFKDVKGTGYQLVGSIIAIAKGSLLGKGLGNGTQKLGWLPEIESDFIFSNVSEELGLVGVIAIFVLFLILFVNLYKKINKMQDQFLKIMSFGLLGGIYANIFINLGGISGAIPMSGVPLPFFSAGVTNLIITFMTIGLIQVAYQCDLDMQNDFAVYNEYEEAKKAKMEIKKEKEAIKKRIKSSKVQVVKVKKDQINELKKNKNIKVKKVNKKGSWWKK